MKKQEILTKVREQEAFLLKTRENLNKRSINWLENTTYKFERARLIGMLDILDILNIDRSEFNWIF
jgi:hypothetical protein